MLTAISNIDKLSGHAFNIGCGQKNSTSLLEVIKKIEALTGRECRYSFDDWRPGDQKYYISNTQRFQELTGWQPKVDIQQGLTLLHQWLIDSDSQHLSEPGESGKASNKFP